MVRVWVKKGEYLHLLGGPHIKIDGFDAADVRAHPAVDARTAYAEIHPAGNARK